MKHLINILIIAILLVGCRSTKKITESNTKVETKNEINQSKYTSLDTNLNISESGNVNNDILIKEITKITEDEYFPPTKQDSIKAKAENKPIKGAIKSSRTTETVREQIDKSKAETAKNTQAEDNSNIKEENSSKKAENSVVETKDTEKKSVPIRWGWIFTCIALCSGLFIYFSKTKIAVIVKTFIKKLFV